MSDLVINSSPVYILPPAPPTARAVGAGGTASTAETGDTTSAFEFAKNTSNAITETQNRFVTPQQVALSNFVDFFQKINFAMTRLKDSISAGDENKIKVNFAQVRLILEQIIKKPEIMATGFPTKEAAEKFLQESGLSTTSGDFPITNTFIVVPKDGNPYAQPKLVLDKATTQAEALQALMAAGLKPEDYAVMQRYTVWLPTQQVEAIAESMPVDYTYVVDYDQMDQNRRDALVDHIFDAGARDFVLKKLINPEGYTRDNYPKDKAYFDALLSRADSVGWVNDDMKTNWGVPDKLAEGKPLSWDNAKYNAWLAGKDSIMQQLQQSSQFLAERLGHVNDLWNNLVRVLSQSLTEIYETTRSFYNA